MRQSARCIRIGAMALAMLFMTGLSAMAQVTTGSVVGTVKDAQGGVVPGATVTLTSESKGTVLSPTVTNETGDFQFPVTPVDRYTLEITMPSFKTLKQTRRPGEPWIAGGVRGAGSGSRRNDRDDQRQSRESADSGDQRRALVHRSNRVGREPAVRRTEGSHSSRRSRLASAARRGLRPKAPSSACRATSLWTACRRWIPGAAVRRCST